MGCGCSKKVGTNAWYHEQAKLNPNLAELKATAKQAQAESRAEAAQRFRQERQQRLLAQRRISDTAKEVLEESLNAL